MPQPLIIELEPQQVPWLLAVLRSYTTLQLDQTDVYPDPAFHFAFTMHAPRLQTHRELSKHISDTAQIVHKQIIEQMRG